MQEDEDEEPILRTMHNFRDTNVHASVTIVSYISKSLIYYGHLSFPGRP